ncbi:MAG: patatin-like phospholipase family protein [Burkholderiaceae bacterium]
MPLPADPLALVLSSGGPRGFVHVGVIKALDELGVRPDLIVGASVGALVASLYCGGRRGADLEHLAMSLQPLQLATLAIGADATFNGGPLADLVNQWVGQQTIQQLTPRCALVALDATTRKPTAFTAGNTGVAVQASAAIEDRFTPVTIRGRPYVDPDTVMPLPVRIARSLGARRVIAVDASAHEDRGAGRRRAIPRRRQAQTRRHADRCPARRPGAAPGLRVLGQPARAIQSSGDGCRLRADAGATPAVAGIHLIAHWNATSAKLRNLRLCRWT